MVAYLGRSILWCRVLPAVGGAGAVRFAFLGAGISAALLHGGIAHILQERAHTEDGLGRERRCTAALPLWYRISTELQDTHRSTWATPRGSHPLIQVTMERKQLYVACAHLMSKLTRRHYQRH